MQNTEENKIFEQFQIGTSVIAFDGTGTGIVQGLTRTEVGLLRVLVKWDGSGITAETHPSQLKRGESVYQLPEGWIWEEFRSVVGVAAIATPDKKNAVTLDFKRRCFRAGFDSVGEPFGGAPVNTKEYVGRGWKKALVTDAVAYLASWVAVLDVVASSPPYQPYNPNREKIKVTHGFVEEDGSITPRQPGEGEASHDHPGKSTE